MLTNKNKLDNKNESFYEGKFAKTENWHGSKMLFLPILHKLARQRLFARYLKRGKREKIILDIGCGGGNDLYTRYGNVWGLDISRASLSAAAKVYPKTIFASADKIPIKDNTVDVILSADLLGHLPSELKDRVIIETYRTLNAGGQALHYSEIKGDDIFGRWAKQYPREYKKYFIDQDGHLGLELIEDLANRFERAGYKIIKVIPLFKLPFDLTEYCKRFDNEFRQKSQVVNCAVATASSISKIKPLKLLIELLGGLLADFISLFLPKNHAGGVFMVLQKPKK